MTVLPASSLSLSFYSSFVFYFAAIPGGALGFTNDVGLTHVFLSAPPDFSWFFSTAG
jgi:hypothetical protein